MVTIVEGVRIELTKEQIAKVEKRRKQVQKSWLSFQNVLRHFGFRQLKDQKGCYSKGGWYAEIIDRGVWHDVWMVGSGLKDSHLFPGGWIYSEPRELNEELNKALSESNTQNKG